MLNSSICPIDRILTTPGQSEPRSNDNEEVLLVPQSSNTGASAAVSLRLVLPLCRDAISVIYSPNQEG